MPSVVTTSSEEGEPPAPASITPTSELTAEDVEEHAKFKDRFYPEESKANTKGSVGFDCAQDLHETAARLKEGSALFKEKIQQVLDFKVGTRKSKQAAKDVLKLVPLLDVGADICSKAASEASPIGQSKEIHRRLAVARKQEITKSNKNADTRAVLIDEYIKSGGSPSASKPEPSQFLRKPSTRSAKRKRKDLPDPPKPRNGITYGVGEFAEIIFNLPRKKRRPMWMQMMSDEYEHPPYLPVKKSTVYRLFEPLGGRERIRHRR